MHPNVFVGALNNVTRSVGIVDENLREIVFVPDEED
jgi:hypothetical protein